MDHSPQAQFDPARLDELAEIQVHTQELERLWQQIESADQPRPPQQVSPDVSRLSIEVLLEVREFQDRVSSLSDSLTSAVTMVQAAICVVEETFVNAIDILKQGVDTCSHGFREIQSLRLEMDMYPFVPADLHGDPVARAQAEALIATIGTSPVAQLLSELTTSLRALNEQCRAAYLPGRNGGGVLDHGLADGIANHYVPQQDHAGMLDQGFLGGEVEHSYMPEQANTGILDQGFMGGEVEHLFMDDQVNAGVLDHAYMGDELHNQYIPEQHSGGLLDHNFVGGVVDNHYIPEQDNGGMLHHGFVGGELEHRYPVPRIQMRITHRVEVTTDYVLEGVEDDEYV